MKRIVRKALTGVALGVSMLVVAGCSADTPKHMRPLSHSTILAMENKGFSKDDPILLRIFKQESEMEVWKKSSKDGKFRKFRTYDICKWSGKLGPKHQEGDRQAPEGFYHVSPALMNPNSSYHLSFNIGYPNSFDRAHGRTGTHLMVHGSCSSAGCYAMQDEQIEEIYSLAREAFDAGQRAFQVQAYPFRMTPENLAENSRNENISFWRMLKEGSDHFETTLKQPAVGVCDRRYVFNSETGKLDPTGACPELIVPGYIQAAVAAKQAEDFALERVALAKLEKKWRKEDPGYGSTPDIMIADASIVPASDTVPATTAAITAETAAVRNEEPGRGFFSRFRKTLAPRNINPQVEASPAPLEADPIEVAPLPLERPDVAANAQDALQAAVVGLRWSKPLPALGFLPQRWR